MKKLLIIAVALLLVYAILQELGISIPGYPLLAPEAESTLQKAFQNRQSNIQIQGEGIVAKILRDDLKGSRHQRFIVKLSTGQTLLIAHNIDLAPRIKNLKAGDTIAFYGEYEWNNKGGVIHWTHHDPKGQHVGGWLKHKGKVYR